MTTTDEKTRTTDAAGTPAARAPKGSKTPLVIVVLIAIGVGGGVFWHKVVREQLFPKNFGVVAEGRVFRSGELTERMLRHVIEEHEIRTVIDLGAWSPSEPEFAREQAVCEELGVTRHVFGLVGDGSGDPNRYVDALRVMTDPEAQPVLVHCAAGAQRTGGVVMMYRRLVDGQSFETAYEEAARYRHEPGKDSRLLTYLVEWADEIEDGFRRGVAIPYPADAERSTPDDAPPPASQPADHDE